MHMSIQQSCVSIRNIYSVTKCLFGRNFHFRKSTFFEWRWLVSFNWEFISINDIYIYIHTHKQTYGYIYIYIYTLILGNEVKTKKYHPCKMAKISAKNEERKMAKISTKNEEDKMAAEPRARYKQHSRSQREKVERKEAKLPHLNKQKDKGTSHQGKDKTPKNNGNKFPDTYREDKRKMRGPSQMAKEEFEKGNEVLLLSSNKGPHMWWTIYRSLHNITENRHEDI